MVRICLSTVFTVTTCPPGSTCHSAPIAFRRHRHAHWEKATSPRAPCQGLFGAAFPGVQPADRAGRRADHGRCEGIPHAPGHGEESERLDAEPGLQRAPAALPIGCPMRLRGTPQIARADGASGGGSAGIRIAEQLSERGRPLVHSGVLLAALRGSNPDAKKLAPLSA